MSYRLINSNEIAIKYPEVNEMDCIYVDLPNGLDNEYHYIDAEPVMHGHWVAMNADGRGYADEFGCTNCSCVVKYGCFTKGCDYERCPYCGAMMDEVTKNEIDTSDKRE